ncbi:hypothetical protein HC928_22080 [bacterium]|nr:hypothetical protein [bacterium]
MAIALSQDDFFTLLQENAAGQPPDSYATDIIWKYPPQLGHGFEREIYLRDGLGLAIAQPPVEQLPLLIQIHDR